MAHQCLKCGKTYADGSAQILKGCEGCKGTRFFYTQAPLDESKRQELADQTEVDLERLALGKGAREAAKPRTIPTKDELPVGRERDHDWVAGGPNYLRGVVEDVVRRAHERKPVFRVGGPVDRSKTLGEWVREEGGAVEDEADDRPVEVLDDLFSGEREADWRRESVPKELEPAEDVQAPAGVPDEEDVVYQRAPRPVPRPVSLAGAAVEAEEDAAQREEARKARELLEQVKPCPKPELKPSTGVEESLYPEGQAPETVAISGSGIYELDVKRLLEKSPIVVHKDGTYSLHLPSLMESLEGRKKR